MAFKPYAPKPDPTAAVALSPEIRRFSEQLAGNAHDLWARERLAQGWAWGAQRNDELKLHPCLVSYADLPESEKNLDREAALGTLRAAMALGSVLKLPPNRSIQPGSKRRTRGKRRCGRRRPGFGRIASIRVAGITTWTIKPSWIPGY